MLNRIVLLMVLFSLMAFVEAYGKGYAYLSISEEIPFCRFLPDTILTIVPDSTAVDSLSAKNSKEMLEAKVDYKANDSTLFDLVNKKVFLYGKAEINYTDINLKADYIEIDFGKNEVYATGLPDSTGKLAGLPVFKQGTQTFESEVMRYNFKSKKGYISKVVTEDGSGYLHGAIVKKEANDVVDISKGWYTTCNLPEHPHFAFVFNKSMVIPKKRIVTGPAYLEIEDVPTPLALPFGWFPNKENQRSGIVFPTFGESANRGFYFEGVGYYQYINDYLDFKVTADIYTLGSWSVKPGFNYKKRYKYTGSANFTYSINVTGVKETPDYASRRDFSIKWSHRQDPKARPNSTFTADVDIRSAKNNLYNPTTTQDFLSNTFKSSISYQKNFAGKYFLNLIATHSQNTQTHVVNVTLPSLTFAVNRFNPFLSPKKVGRTKWYNNITMQYNMKAENMVTAGDSVILTSAALNMMRNGIEHTLPIASSVKLLKFINWTNSINLDDKMYFVSYRQHWSYDTLFNKNDTTVGYLAKDTINGFNNVFEASYSSSLSTKMYGMVQFGKKFPINAIRHVLTPSVSFTYKPDFGTDFWNYWDSYTDTTGNEAKYSKYAGSLYGGPLSGRSERINFKFDNNLEMKVRSRKDTINGTKKVGLLDNFTINFSYDFAKDSLKWSALTLSGRTRFFKNIDVSYGSSLDPYIIDSTGRNLNRTEWSVNHRLLRLQNTNWTVSLNWRVTSDNLKKKKETKPAVPVSSGNEAEAEEIKMTPNDYIDWSIPWDVTFSYSFRYDAVRNYTNYIYARNTKIVQTLAAAGNISITPKWKIGFRTGWDFISHDLSYTSISVYRDLHCWEMRFNWIPTGMQKSWNFSINAKASILQDLKLNKKKDFRDNF